MFSGISNTQTAKQYSWVGRDGGYTYAMGWLGRSLFQAHMLRIFPTEPYISISETKFPFHEGLMDWFMFPKLTIGWPILPRFTNFSEKYTWDVLSQERDVYLPRSWKPLGEWTKWATREPAAVYRWGQVLEKCVSEFRDSCFSTRHRHQRKTRVRSFGLNLPSIHGVGT